MKHATIIAALALAGCVSSGTQVREDQLAQFQKGVTTEREVEAKLGAPQLNTLAADGSRVIEYMFTREHATAATYVPIVGMFAGGAEGTTNTVTFRFDAGGKLLDYSSSTGHVGVRTGIANGGQSH